jgi:hypothetical protein
MSSLAYSQAARGLVVREIVLKGSRLSEGNYVHTNRGEIVAAGENVNDQGNGCGNGRFRSHWAHCGDVVESVDLHWTR